MASLLLSLISAIVLISPVTSQSPPASWKLALHWPNSFCRDSGVKCGSSIPNNSFVVRTLFGLNENGEEVKCSGAQPPLDPSSIARFQQTLTLVWPDLQGNDFGFWEREWQQRAACFGVDPAFYFSNAISLRGDIDNQIVKGFGGVGFPLGNDEVFGALFRQDVQPGKTYPGTTFAEKVSSKYGEALEVLCDNDASTVNQLLEFHMCANATTFKYSLIPCSSQKSIGCGNNVRFT